MLRISGPGRSKYARTARRVIIASAALSIAPLAVETLHSQFAPEQAAFATRPKVEQRLRQMAQMGGPLRVLIALREQPHRRILERHEASAVEELEFARQHIAKAHPRNAADARRELDRIHVRIRRSAFEEIDRAIASSQASVESALVRNGGKVLQRHDAINMIAAEIPAEALDAIAAHPQVAEVSPIENAYARLSNSVPALGASYFWNAGFTGAGQTIAVLDTGARTNHPALAGVDINSTVFLSVGSLDACFGDDFTAQDGQGHGAHIAGIVASRGSSECTSCRGMAPGLGTLYNIKVGYRLKLTQACSGNATTPTAISSQSDVLNAINWLVRNTPARIVSYSFGSDTGQDDNSFARSIDQLIDLYGLVVTIAAGNTGPDPYTVESPANAHNILSVGNWSGRGAMHFKSSRGPTTGGRKKPDIAAPGTNILSTAHNWDSAGSADFVLKTGTSMAAPHIAGAAALIAQAGVTDPLAIKAILLNTTDNPGWESDRGWGYANLESALRSLNVRAGQLAARPQPGYRRLYRVRSPGGPLRATVVWNRHITPGLVSALNNIDVSAYGAATNTQLHVSASDRDNVEQVYTNTAEDVVIKVSMSSVSLAGGVTTEKYAAAFSVDRVDTIIGPLPDLTCTPSANPVNPGAAFQVSCRVANGGDLPAFNVTGNVAAPAGFAGGGALNFGTVQPLNTSNGIATMTAPAAPGSYTIAASASASSYGEQYAASTNTTITVSAPVPAAPSAPAPSTGSAWVSTSPVLTWTGDPKATSYEVYFGTTSPPLFIATTAGTSYTPATLSAGVTHYWRIRAKNASGFADSPIWWFTSANGNSVITTDPPGRGFTVDGSAYSATQSFPWAAGTAHQICTTSVQSGTPGVQYLWQNWSDGGTLCHTVTVPQGARTYTALFKTQYRLTVSATPSAGGSVTPAPGAWYDANTLAAASASPNPGYAFGSWTGDITSNQNPLTFTITGPRSITANFVQTGTVSLSSASAAAAGAGSQGTVAVTWSSPSQSWTAVSNAPWITITAGAAGVGNGTVQYTVAANPSGSARSGTLTIAGQPFTIAQEPNPALIGLRFVPITPCRAADTRNAPGPLGGPVLLADESREFDVPRSTCGVPETAAAYSLNVTVVPPGPLGYVTLWPARQPRPTASTLNSHDGRIKANAAIVAAGYAGAISVFASNPTHVVLDINGYFVPNTQPAALAFYPVVPCRIADTRVSGGTLSAGTTRAFPVLSTSCGIPAAARAYSLNMTVVPKSTLSYLTVWPSGQTRPAVSTLNAPTGAITANAAIVQAGDSGAIHAFATENTELVIDIAGYFAPPVTGGLSLYAKPPCRVIDTRIPSGAPAATGRLDIAVAASSCAVPLSAQAYVFNVTAVPPAPLGYLTLWPGASAPMPVVSTLNAADATVTSNLAIVPATNGAISAYRSNPTHVVLDLSAHFAP